jgi:hypothetical protein
VRLTRIWFESFLDGFTGGSLFTPLRRPGAPTQLFADDPEETDDPEQTDDRSVDQELINIGFESFFEGFTGGNLFTPFRRPGAPTQLFADDPEETDELIKPDFPSKP